MRRIGITVIVCCYNSALRLPKVFDYLANALDSECEVLVVDNNSDDTTVDVALSEDRYEIRVIQCTIQGQAHARKMGVLNAKGEYVIFVDDDNYLDCGYMDRVRSVLKKHSSVVAVGGFSAAVFDENFTVPDWFVKHNYGYAIGSNEQSSSFVDSSGALLYGAGLAVRRNLLLKIYQSEFIPVLGGRAKNGLLSGDDSELCLMLMLCGGKLFYCHDARFFHYLPAQRIQIDYCKRLFYGFGHSKPHLSFYRAYLSDGKRIRRNIFLNIALCWGSSIKYYLVNSNTVSLSELKGCWDGGIKCYEMRTQLLQNIRIAQQIKREIS